MGTALRSISPGQARTTSLLACTFRTLPTVDWLPATCSRPLSLTNAKPSAIYRLRPHLPADAPLPASGGSPPANLGIEIAPLAQLEGLLASIEGGSGDKGKGKEVAGKVEVGKIAEKVVKNVSTLLACFSDDS